MSSDIAISVRGISKGYGLRHNRERHTTLGEAFVHRFIHPFERPEREQFWALSKVSFDVRQGDVLGLVGRNGAGKSTLLKILSRITAPTCGEVNIYGRVGSLLEVGTGFHPELTGRENVYLNGSILGMRRREIDQRFEEIIDFAGVEKFLDTPVKRYSSGMYVRLAFAVAAHLDAEILLIDEVLAVGDGEFQKKCLAKMSDAASEGRVILFVSHNLAAIERLCSSAILLDKGTIRCEGPVPDVVRTYSAQAEKQSDDTGGRVITSVESRRDGGLTSVFAIGERVDFILHIQDSAILAEGGVIGLALRSESGAKVVGFNTAMAGRSFGRGGETVLRLSIPRLSLAPGEYQVDVGATDYYSRDLEYLAAIRTLTIVAGDFFGSGYLPTAEEALVFMDHSWSFARDDTRSC